MSGELHYFDHGGTDSAVVTDKSLNLSSVERNKACFSFTQRLFQFGQFSFMLQTCRLEHTASRVAKAENERDGGDFNG